MLRHELNACATVTWFVGDTAAAGWSVLNQGSQGTTCA
jgi:hypothetical protein